MIQRKIAPSTIVRRPANRNTDFQGSMAEPCFSLPTAIPYATSPPNTWPHPLKLNQILTRLPCSSFVYHWHCQQKFYGDNDVATNLRRQESKSRGHRSFKNTQEKADSNCPRIILNSRKTAEDQTPYQDTCCRVFSQGKTLKESIGGIFPCQIACLVRY